MKKITHTHCREIRRQIRELFGRVSLEVGLRYSGDNLTANALEWDEGADLFDFMTLEDMVKTPIPSYGFQLDAYVYELTPFTDERELLTNAIVKISADGGTVRVEEEGGPA